MTPRTSSACTRRHVHMPSGGCGQLVVWSSTIAGFIVAQPRVSWSRPSTWPSSWATTRAISSRLSAWDDRALKVLATRRYPGPAFDELADVEVLPLASLDQPRHDVEALVVANEPVPLELLPSLQIVAN